MWKRKSYLINNKKRKFNYPHKFFLIFLIIVFVSAGYMVFRSRVFAIKNFDLQKEDANCVEDSYIKEKSGILGRNLLLFNGEKDSKDLKKQFICIKNVNFSKIIPNKIRINIIGRKSAMQLISVNNWEASASSLIENISTPSASLIGDFYIVDDEGVVFSKESTLGDNPKVYFFKKGFLIGVQLQDESLKKAQIIINQLRNNGIEVKSMTIYNNLFIVDSLPRVIFSLDGNVDVQIASLQLILQKAKINGDNLAFIDLRFDKPIVKFVPKKN